MRNDSLVMISVVSMALLASGCSSLGQSSLAQEDTTLVYDISQKNSANQRVNNISVTFEDRSDDTFSLVLDLRVGGQGEENMFTLNRDDLSFQSQVDGNDALVYAMPLQFISTSSNMTSEQVERLMVEGERVEVSSDGSSGVLTRGDMIDYNGYDAYNVTYNPEQQDRPLSFVVHASRPYPMLKFDVAVEDITLTIAEVREG